MATPADQRLLELLDKWLQSLELHARYTGLDTDSYWKVQPWPEHQRPSRWIIDLALQKTTALKAQLQERIKQGDTKFADSLELMTFLANLIGSEHIERFIPLADKGEERDLRAEAAATPAAPAPAAAAPAAASPAVAAPAAAAAEAPSSGTTTVTREMPRFVPPKRGSGKSAPPGVGDSATREMPEFAQPKRRSPPPVATPQVARTERRAAESKAPPKNSGRQPAKLPPPSAAETAREQVIADAARLVQWGRKWYELAELIARMADRPPLPEVRRILKDNKTAIEKKAGK
jgi:hypothetical protein